ncbi:MAG: TIGR03905 family TSCPD domain-containing protein [Eubacteriaceae bacterium]|nr:TIGR03905 family TSCPD domain-containing protein [Eubacteriaceae bacterium]
MKHSYKPKGVCSTNIQFDLEDGMIRDLEFANGCEGNLKAIGKLVEGMPAEKVIELLEGNTCGRKGTSCADQLAKALKEAL